MLILIVSSDENLVGRQKSVAQKKNYASKKTDPDSQHFFHNKEDKYSFKKLIRIRNIL